MDRQQKTIGVVLTLGVFLASVGVVAAYSDGDLGGTLSAWEGWKTWKGRAAEALERASRGHEENGRSGEHAQGATPAEANVTRGEPGANVTRAEPSPHADEAARSDPATRGGATARDAS